MSMLFNKLLASQQRKVVLTTQVMLLNKIKSTPIFKSVFLLVLELFSYQNSKI